MSGDFYDPDDFAEKDPPRRFCDCAACRHFEDDEDPDE